MRNPVRRNRNIGTKAAGHGQNNEMRVPEPVQRGKGYHLSHENLGHVSVSRHDLAGQLVSFLIEDTRPGVTFGRAPDAALPVLQKLAEAGFNLPDLLVFRQPTEKQISQLPVWGRMQFWAELSVQGHPGPRGSALMIDAQRVGSEFFWPRKPTLADQEELTRLSNDGHQIAEERRGYQICLTEEGIGNTLFRRTLLHEFGHWVDYLRHSGQKDDGETFFQRPSREREAFAHRFAREWQAECAV